MLPSDLCFIAGTLGQGGAERQLYYLLQSLQKSGVQLRVLCLTKGEFWEKRIRDLGIPVTWVGEKGSKSSRLARIIKCLRKNPPQILQSQHVFTNLYAVAAARTLRIRELGALRNSGATEVWSSGKVIGRLNLRAPRALVVNSQSAMRRAISLGVPEKNLLFLPNVVDSNQFEPAPQCQDQPIKLITVGRLVKEKRMDRFISTVAQLRHKTTSPIRATILGAGPLRKRLEDQARELGLTPEILEMKQPVQDMAPIYQNSDIFVLTSDFEGTPNVVLEAMASGLPVVATAVGGVPEVIRDGDTGYLVKPSENGAMLPALQALINSSQLRAEIGGRGRAFIETNHSVNLLPSLLEKLYSAALS